MTVPASGGRLPRHCPPRNERVEIATSLLAIKSPVPMTQKRTMNVLKNQMANCITGIRIICAVLLIFCQAFSLSFYVLYVLGGLTDVLDGIAARLLKTESKLGAKLDTIADIAFSVVVLIKVLSVVYFPPWIIVWVACIAVIKFINIISGFILKGRFVSEHTPLNKITGFLLFLIPLYIGLLTWQAVSVLIILTGLAATVAAIQEGHYIRTGKEVD